MSAPATWRGLASVAVRVVLPLVCAALLAPEPGFAAPDADRKPELAFRFALQPNPANKVWEAAILVREYLERESGGRIQIQFYDSGVLGAERQVLEACYLGVIEMVQCTSSVVTTVDPAFSLLDMPFMFVSEKHHVSVMNGPIGQELLDGLRRHRLQGLAFYSCGFRHVFTKGIPVHGPEALEGQKIRVMESPVMIDALNYMGASATPLSAGELFQALKTGVVDGAENNPNVFISEKFYEAGCDHVSLTGHFANQHVLVVNHKWFETLRQEKPDLHALIAKAARAILPEYRRRWDKALDDAFTDMKKHDVTVVREIDKKPFIERVQPLYDKFFESYPEVDRTLVDRIRKEAGL